MVRAAPAADVRSASWPSPASVGGKRKTAAEKKERGRLRHLDGLQQLGHTRPRVRQRDGGSDRAAAKAATGQLDEWNLARASESVTSAQE